jgi:hypothetical protein
MKFPGKDDRIMPGYGGQLQRTGSDSPLLIFWLEMDSEKQYYFVICTVGYACTVFPVLILLGLRMEDVTKL